MSFYRTRAYCVNFLKILAPALFAGTQSELDASKIKFLLHIFDKSLHKYSSYP
jgi:hypothetical protein